MWRRARDVDRLALEFWPVDASRLAFRAVALFEMNGARRVKEVTRKKGEGALNLLKAAQLRSHAAGAPELEHEGRRFRSMDGGDQRRGGRDETQGGQGDDACPPRENVGRRCWISHANLRITSRTRRPRRRGASPRCRVWRRRRSGHTGLSPRVVYDCPFSLTATGRSDRPPSPPPRRPAPAARRPSPSSRCACRRWRPPRARRPS